MGIKHLNSIFLSDKPTGLGVYSKEILKRANSFFNTNGFQVLLQKDLSSQSIEVANPQFLHPKIASNPIFRSLFYNRLRSSFFYSFTHHGRTNKRDGNQIITIHDLIPIHFPNQYRSQYFYYKYYLPKIIEASDCVFTISQYTKQDIINVYGTREEKIKVIYNGFEHLKSDQIQRKEESRIHNKPYILMVGTTFPHKNLHTVINAFDKIASIIQLDCIIVGKVTPYYHQLMKLVHEKKLQHRIHFKGYITDEEMKTLYSQAEMFIYPSLYEGFGLPILEAMYYDVPTIVANTTVHPEIAGKASILVNPNEINEFADSILSILENSTLKRRLIDEGKFNITRFSWDRSANDIVKILGQYV
jgi:glycosyltransferase involved in cell wall biosynthesis